jgi:Domain of unknown function (DUF1707)
MMSLPPIRATDRDREDTAEQLRAAFTAGCLDSDELSERAGRAYAAVTRDELRYLIRDLPGALAPVKRARPWSFRAPWRVLGWEFSLMLAVSGAWLISVALQSVTAVPFILLWLVALRTVGWMPRLAARHARGSRRHPL